jgi:hypothetical protein
MKTENITKASQTASLLLSDLQEAHKAAENVAEEILLLDMIETTRKLKDRLNWLGTERKKK